MTNSERSITPMPTEEEAVAIAAALEFGWPRPVITVADSATRQTSAWRFSGRWWTKNVATRRDRPVI